MTIVITGANGQTGRAVIRHLVGKGAQPIAMTSNERSAEALRTLGAQATIADFRNVASLVKAFEGAERVFHVPPRMQPDETQIGLNVIKACIAAGVTHLVVHSVITPHLEDIVFHWAKMKVEAALFHHGLQLPYTIVRPTNYMQNAEWFWDQIANEGRFIYPYSAEAALTWLDIEDLGESVANILTETEHEFATYELCGRNALLNRHQMAGIWSSVLGRDVRAEVMDLDAYMAQPRWAGRKPEDLERLQTMFRHYDHYGFPTGNHRTLSMLLRRPATAYFDYAARTAQARGSKAKTNT